MRNEARAIASSGKGARQVWAELKQWAGTRGPAATKCAMIEFLGTYGGTPEAAYVMPELMRNATQSFSPSERGELVRLAMRRNVPDMRPAKLVSAKPFMPNPSDRSALALNFRPVSRDGAAPRLGVIEPVSSNHDLAYMRDMPVRARERLESAMLPPPRFQGEQSRHFDPRKSPDSHPLGAQKGEHIVRSLIHSVRSHGRDDAPHMSPAVPVRKAPKKAVRVSKRSKAAKPAKRRIARSTIKKANKARVPARKSASKARAARFAKSPIRRQKRRKR
ncbi:MAG: hypothetical protein WC483_04655 [Candidatus Paceibacterota bacterium]